MNLPKRAEDAHSHLAAAFNSGNVDTVLSMYDFNGIIVPEPGKPVSGKEKFEEAIKSIFPSKEKWKSKPFTVFRPEIWLSVGQNGISLMAKK